MAFRPDRLKGLREAKGLSQEQLAELAGLSQSAITKAEIGKSVPTSDVLDKLASALDSTMDYLYGRADYGDPASAATQMSFDVFARGSGVTEPQRERCRRLIKHPDAPRTMQAWRALAEMIELAVEPNPGNLEIVKHRPSKVRPVALSRNRLT